MTRKAISKGPGSIPAPDIICGAWTVKAGMVRCLFAIGDGARNVLSKPRCFGARCGHGSRNALPQPRCSGACFGHRAVLSNKPRVRIAFPEFGFGSVSTLPGSDSDRFRRARFGFGSVSPGQVRIRIGFAGPGSDSDRIHYTTTVIRRVDHSCKIMENSALQV